MLKIQFSRMCCNQNAIDIIWRKKINVFFVEINVLIFAHFLCSHFMYVKQQQNSKQ